MAEYVGLHRCFDAEVPPIRPLPGFDSVLGYIGGAELAGKPWTREQWQPFAGLAQFPCYVPSLARYASAQANEACVLARDLGWRPGRAIVFDLETAKAPGWWSACRERTRELGYVPVAYGSVSTLPYNRAALMWGADWNDVPELVEDGQSFEAMQIENTPAYDVSVVSHWLYLRAGTGART